MGIWDHTRLQAEGRSKGLDADMQQPTACREDEGNRVRSVVPKLIAKESRMPSREAAHSSGSQDWAVTWRRSARGRRGWRRTFVGARLRKDHAEKTIAVRETKGGAGARACVLPEMHKCPRAPWKKAPTRERTRSIPCAKAVRCARAAVAPTHVEHVERRS